MRTLVAFGTTEGQTRKIAHHIEGFVRSAGNGCVVHDCEELDPELDVGSFDAIMLAGSVHQQLHQPKLTAFAKEHLAVLKSRPSAFISVSLSILMEDSDSETLKYLTEFSRETGWKPEYVHFAAGAIRSLEYDFFKAFTVNQIVFKGGKIPEHAGPNPEYTDWDALDAFVGSFLEDAAASPAA